MTSELRVKCLRDNVVLPVRGTVGAAGYDISAASVVVTPPPSGAASPSTWAERDAFPQIKDYIIDLQDALKAPGYIAKVWAHYKTIRGAPFPHIMSQS